jgi:hypothetical protein
VVAHDLNEVEHIERATEVEANGGPVGRHASRVWRLYP